MKYVKKGTVIILAALFCLTVLWGRSGLFSFAEDPVIYGDVDGNGKINLQDAQMVLQAALKIKGLEAAAHQAADVSGDRQVTLEDAQLVLKYALRIITAFPVQATDLPEEKPEQPEEGAEILVAYFSKTGTTRAMAEQIQQETGGTLFEIPASSTINLSLGERPVYAPVSTSNAPVSVSRDGSVFNASSVSHAGQRLRSTFWGLTIPYFSIP